MQLLCNLCLLSVFEDKISPSFYRAKQLDFRLSEPSLWVPWKHLGVCEAEKPGVDGRRMTRLCVRVVTTHNITMVNDG